MLFVAGLLAAVVSHHGAHAALLSATACSVPDPMIPLTERGHEQARQAGRAIKKLMEMDGSPYRLHFYISPYQRSKETYHSLVGNFDKKKVVGVQ